MLAAVTLRGELSSDRRCDGFSSSLWSTNRSSRC